MNGKCKTKSVYILFLADLEGPEGTTIGMFKTTFHCTNILQIINSEKSHTHRFIMHTICNPLTTTAELKLSLH